MKELNFRLTDSCQLECIHCYADSGPKRKERFPENLIGMAIQKYGEISKRIGGIRGEPIFVNLTGGEATLLGVDYLKKTVDTIREHLALFSSSFSPIGLVTNLLAFNKELAGFGKNYKVKFLTSFDPVIRILDGSYEKFKKAWLRKYAESKELGFDISVQFTITRHLLDFPIHQFIEENQIEEIQLLPFQPVGRGKTNLKDIGITRKETSEYIIGMMKNRPPGLKVIQPYDEVKTENKKRFLTGSGGADCWDACQNSFAVGYDGAISSLGNCVGGYGNILTDTVDKILSSPNRLEYIIQKTTEKSCEACGTCPHTYFCRGGCVSFKEIPSGGECHGLKKVLDYCIGTHGEQS